MYADGFDLVDICITTEWKEMESVCMIADLLAKRECDEFWLMGNH